ncbi:beta-glucoside-specific PTS transporter subunit IIABC [uncultured Enterococcus sp.]|uniref:beta-glucoside-specific PTS transporter subunit IIABC n=1 Tax=uncultured Enterococcus sp. TaxID=167972 RepID=UPI002635D1C9|nr:beta-glucoside-specific PTS transporter subunit IIABC [uncultured Enterococcus sp.]
MDNKTLAKQILNLIGGKENVASLTHCVTRLRFKLNNPAKAKKEEIQQLEGVLTVVENIGQFQVVIGKEVANVYKEITQIIGFSTDLGEEETTEKLPLTSRIFDIISGSFTPLLGVLSGSGVLKGILAILTNYQLLSPDSGTYHILAAAGNGLFYFLPIFLGISIANKLGANMYVGGVIGAALMEPNITGLLANKTTDFLGIPVVLMDYATTIFPIFIAMIVYAQLEKGLKKIIFKDIQLFMVPLLSLVIMVPAILLVFGPFGMYVGNLISAVINFLSGKSGLLAGAVMGGSWPFLVMLGIHVGLTPIVIANLANGGDPLLAMVAAAIFAEIGIALGIVIRSKDNKIKTAAASTIFPGLAGGVTEPIIYGFIVRYKKTIPYLIISGGLGGAIIGFFSVKQIALVSPSLLTIAVNTPFVPYVIAIFVSFILAVLLTVIFGYEEKQLAAEDSSLENTKIENHKDISLENPLVKSEVYSPLTGTVRALSDVNDVTFAEELLGKGIAILPENGEVYAPFDGKVEMVFQTKHAIGLKSHQGVELLIHIGLETVKLGGQYFETLVQDGDEIKQGQLLVRFDMQAIKNEGFDIITPIIVTNTTDYLDVLSVVDGMVKQGDLLLKLV